MRVAMFEGYGQVAAPVLGYGQDGLVTDPAVEQLIQGNVGVLQDVQARLWEAHSSWVTGRLLSGLAWPPGLALRIGAFDYTNAVNAWQSSVDAWWGSNLTDVVRAAPYEVGSDGKTRVQAWIDMGQRLIPWAGDIGTQMGDDTLIRDVKVFGQTFQRIVNDFISAGGKLILGAIPDWLKWGAAGLAAFVLIMKFAPGGRR